MKAKKLGAMAANAMAYMLAATVKPGLVDRHNNGIYTDMDYYTVLAGIGAVTPWLIEIAKEGVESVSMSPTELFSRVRSMGINAERDMFKATKGVNTHKGGFFAVALCAAAAGRVASGNMKPDSNSVCAVAAEMCHGLCKRELDTLDVKVKLIGIDSLSRGEQMYMKYGMTGMRGEAESGFATVRKHAMPVLRKSGYGNNISTNDIYVQTFLTLMANTNDTCIMARESLIAIEEMKDRSNGIIERGGAFTPLGLEKIKKLDTHLKERNMSPSASAALLAAAIFLHSLDEELVVKRR